MATPALQTSPTLEEKKPIKMSNPSQMGGCSESGGGTKQEIRTQGSQGVGHRKGFLEAMTSNWNPEWHSKESQGNSTGGSEAQRGPFQAQEEFQVGYKGWD